MRLPKVKPFNYGLKYKSWALVVSITTENVVLQIFPFRVYIGWHPLDYLLE